MENRVEADKPQCVHAAHVAQAPSGCAHHHSDKATDLLSDEHRVIERVLVVLEKLTTRPVEKSLDCWKKALDSYSVQSENLFLTSSCCQKVDNFLNGIIRSAIGGLQFAV